jgi:hypothetical protein
MRELLIGSPGARLTRAEYGKDFAARQWAEDGHDSWKFERQQHFQEPTNPSWHAFSMGAWDEALRLIEARRDDLHSQMREAASHHCRLLRVRVVETPLTPYLQWELHMLRLRAETGELIRVVDSAQVERFEHDGTLPELVTLGSDTVYRILYDEDDVPDGAIRYSDPDVNREVIAFISDLYAAGEDIQDFFNRNVAWLPAPAPDADTPLA